MSLLPDPKEPGMLFGREPVLILEAVRAVVIAAVAFGLPLTDVQQGAVLLVASTLLSVAARQRVEPVH